MKYRLFFLSLLLVAVSAMGAESPREIINFNREWKFQLGDHTGADAAGFDDSQWDLIGLPHSFSIPYFESPQFYVGYGCFSGHGGFCERDAGRRAQGWVHGVYL
jgi:hypothetical protein